MLISAFWCNLVQFGALKCNLGWLVQLCADWCNLMLIGAFWCNFVQFGATWAVWCTLSAAWCWLVQLGAVWWNLVLFGALKCNLVQIGAAWCKLVQFGAIGATGCWLVQLGAFWCNLVLFGATWCYLVQLSATWTKKRVGSSSGRSQDCVRLGTSQDKSRFDLFELSFSTITVFWERKLRAQGFLHKEIRICAVVGCSSSAYQLQKWRKGFCTSHNCHRTSQDCTCPDLFQLYPCPTFKGDPEKRKEWVKSINQKTLKQGKTGSQAKMTGFVPNVLWMDSLP